MSQKQLKILVTGASGFLGRQALDALTHIAGVTPIAACRSLERLPDTFRGEVRPGNLRDADYRLSVVQDVDVVCNAASWAAMWNHAARERQEFFEPTLALIDAAQTAGVARFIQASTVATNAVHKDGRAHADRAAPQKTGHWPHLDFLVEVESYLQRHTGSMQKVVLRFGHFVGRGNRLGMLPALAPRLKTHLVPWLGRAQKRLPLVGDSDLGQGFARAALAEHLENFESFNICGPEFPTLREVVTFVAKEARLPLPHYRVPYSVGYAFAWLMEKLNPLLLGDPFLTRSIVHLCEDWFAPNDRAEQKLGYAPQKDWRVAISEQLAELSRESFPWLRLIQA